MKKIMSLLSVIAILLTMSVQVFAGDIPEALGYEDDAQVFIGTLKDFKVDNSSSPKVENVQVLPTYKIKGEVVINELQTYELCYFGKVAPEKDKEYLFGWLADNSVWVYAIESYNENRIKLKITDEFAERVQSHLDDGLYEQGEVKRIEKGRALEKIKNAKIMSELFVFDRNDVVEMEVVYPGDGDPNGCNIDKEKFFDIAEKISLTPKNRIDELDKGVWIIAVDKNNERHSIWLDSKGRVGFPQYETSSAITTQYDISDADYIKLYAFLPKEATAHIPLENPMKNYMVVIIGAGVLVFAAAFIIGFTVKKKRG